MEPVLWHLRLKSVNGVVCTFSKRILNYNYGFRVAIEFCDNNSFVHWFDICKYIVCFVPRVAFLLFRQTSCVISVFIWSCLYTIVSFFFIVMNSFWSTSLKTEFFEFLNVDDGSSCCYSCLAVVTLSEEK